MKTELVEIEKKKYKLVTELNYISEIRNDDLSILAVDPVGGPFLCKGYKILDTEKIKTITWNSKEKAYIIETEDA